MSASVLPEVAIHHVSISVPDLEAALAWYGEIFGFEVQFRMGIESMNAKGAFVKRGDMRLELWQIEGGFPVPSGRREPNTDLQTAGTKHVAFAIPDLQAFLERLVRRGVDIAAIQRDPTQPMQPDADPLARDKPTAFAAFIRDPAGVLIELVDAARAG
jgi:methylmalonyl-CoA/ethylmalonyl-CoA epimerase